MGQSRPLFLYFRLFNTQLTVNKCSIIFGRWLDSNRGPLVSEAIALPTEPHNHCPIIKLFDVKNVLLKSDSPLRWRDVRFPLKKNSRLLALWNLIQKCLMMYVEDRYGRISSVVSSAPTILRPWVQIPSTPSMLLSICIVMLIDFGTRKGRK